MPQASSTQVPLNDQADPAQATRMVDWVRRHSRDPLATTAQEPLTANAGSTPARVAEIIASDSSGLSEPPASVTQPDGPTVIDATEAQAQLVRMNMLAAQLADSERARLVAERRLDDTRQGGARNLMERGLAERGRDDTPVALRATSISELVQGTQPGRIRQATATQYADSVDGRMSLATVPIDDRKRPSLRGHQPEKFTGKNLKSARDFVTELRLLFELNPESFRTEQEKVIYALTYIKGEPRTT